MALASITFFFGSNRIALIGPDEPRYAEIAREMFTSGDYISPTLCGCLWFEKPALFYWLGAGAYRFFGVHEFAARFPSGVAAILCLLSIWFVLSRTGSRNWGLLSGVVLATSGIMIAYSHAATPDMVLTATMTIAILAAYMATRARGGNEYFYIALCGAAIGFSFLAKGLVGIVLVAAILVVYFLLVGRLGFFPRRSLWIGLAVFLVVSSIWYLPVTLRHGREFLDEFFIRHHFQRYISDVYGHPQPFYFFPVIAIMGVLPWSLFLLPAVARLRRLRPRESKRDSLLGLAWVWLAIPLTFFSVSESKLPGYLLPVFPALAILIGAEVERFLQHEGGRLMRIVGVLTAILVICLVGAFVWYLNRQSIAPAGWHMVFVLLPFGFAMMAMIAVFLEKRGGFLLSTLACVVSIVVSGASLLFPSLNEEISLKRLSVEAASALRADEKIGYYILKEYAAVFYSQGRVACGFEEGDVLNALREDKLVPPLEIYPSMIFITRERWLEGLLKDGRFETEFLAQQGDYFALRVHLKRQATSR